MDIQELFRSVSERVQSSASVKAVYGEPIMAEGKTIVPVARVRYGFGAGGGSRAGEASAEEGEERQDTGGGGGGGVDVTPVGFIELTSEKTRYVSFEDRSKIIRAVFLGALVGMFLLRKRLRG